MPRYLVHEFDMSELVQAPGAAQAIGRAEVGQEYVVINADDHTVEWLRGTSAVYNRTTERVEGTHHGTT